ncbi:MAG: glycosyltransferase family 4 protein [Actinomycetota bacterium]|nr:glycosyltransferase family 4 protein [Actinomycetota bacterium]
MITQVIDAEDPVLAATVPKLRALAARCDELVVLAGRVGVHDLPANCTIRRFEAGGKLGRGASFVAAIAPHVLRRRVDAVLAHMCPIYLVLVAPLAKPFGVPLLLWYTHPHASRTLRLASMLASVRTTATASSYPLPAPARAIGHGIDVDAFGCRGRNGVEAPLDVLALGRYSAVKGYGAVLRAVHRAAESGVEARLTIHGSTLNDGERRERLALERLRAELGLEGRVDLHDALPPAEARERLSRADVLVSNTVRGSADKAVLEACASCVPALASTWPDLLPEPLRFEQDDVAALAARLGELAEMGSERRAELGDTLRAVVVERHSTASWADAIVLAAREAAA